MTNTAETGTGTASRSQEPPSASGTAHSHDHSHDQTHHRHRRARYLVDWRYQLRHSAASLLVVGTLLAGLNVALLTGGLPGGASRDALTAGSTTVGTGHGARVLALIAGSIAVMVAFAVVRVLETHRTTGSKLSIARCLDRVRNGQFATWVALREDDDLHDLEAAANAMILSLSQRARTQAHRLELLARRLAVDTQGGNYEVAGALRMLAAEQRSLAGDPPPPQQPEQARALEQFMQGAQDEPTPAGSWDSLASAIVETGPQTIMTAAPAPAAAATSAASSPSTHRDALAAEVLDELDAMAARGATVGTPAGARDRE